MRQSFTSKLLLLNLLVSPFRCLTLFNKIIIRLSRLKNNFLKNKCSIISDVFWKEKKNEKLPGIIIIAVKYVGFLWSRVICTFFFPFYESCKSPLTLCNVWHFHFPATARVNNMFYYSQRQAPAGTLKLIITSEGMWWTFFTVYCKSIILLQFLQVLILKTTNLQVNSRNGFMKFEFLK